MNHFTVKSNIFSYHNVSIYVSNYLAVRCQWKMWSAWKPCSLTCGGGQQPRNRVEIPAQNGGAPCVGPSIESRECNSRACPGDWYN